MMTKSSFFLRLLVACLFLKQQFVDGKPSSDEVSIAITMEDNADNVIDIQNTVDQSSNGGAGEVGTDELSDESSDHNDLASKILGKFELQKTSPVLAFSIGVSLQFAEFPNKFQITKQNL